MILRDKKIIIGITGGIAAYKALELTRLLVKDGAEVHGIMTKAAGEFITPLSLQTLSGNPVSLGLFELTSELKTGHISLADMADIMVITPATANILGKVASGIADDLLTTVIMATEAPVLFAPAMNRNMFENPIVQRNIDSLRSYGYHFVGPDEGELACGYEGKGRIFAPEGILEEVRMLLMSKDLEGERIIVTAGPTRETIDPVRYISNRSTGKMGYAVTKAARRRGAEVTLISGPSFLPRPEGVCFLSVESAEDMRKAVLNTLSSSTALVMTAAVADYRPVEIIKGKIKRGDLKDSTLKLEIVPDILKEVRKKKKGQYLVGFALETEDLTANAKKKLKEKGLDLIVANDITDPLSGFEKDTNRVTFIDKDGKVEQLPVLKKEEVAERILDRIKGRGK